MSLSCVQILHDHACLYACVPARVCLPACLPAMCAGQCTLESKTPGYSETALQLAAKGGHAAVVCALLDAGAEVCSLHLPLPPNT
eukprot:SAG11_NODE_1870_length_4151_cov_2.279368_7_plen_85_part_00